MRNPRLWGVVAMSAALALVLGVLGLAVLAPGLSVASAESASGRLAQLETPTPVDDDDEDDDTATPEVDDDDMTVTPEDDDDEVTPEATREDDDGDLSLDDGTTNLPRTITVVGEGTVNIRPDVAQANIGVEVVSPSVQEGSEEAQQIMDDVLQALQDAGVDEDDIQTAGYNIWAERPVGPQGELTDEVRYHISNNVSVLIRDIENVGAVLDAALEAGANNIYGVNFRIEDPGDVASTAREEALQDAVDKAEEYADFAGLEVGPVVSISEVIGRQGGVFISGRQQLGLNGMGGGGGGPIAPGELEYLQQIEVTFAVEE